MSAKLEYLVSPGKVVRDYVERDMLQVGINQWDLWARAQYLKMDMQELRLVCAGEIPITLAIARKLEKLGRSTRFWLKLESTYQKDRRRLSGISSWLSGQEAEE